jgi:hypothetical protein
MIEIIASSLFWMPTSLEHGRMFNKYTFPSGYKCAKGKGFTTAEPVYLVSLQSKMQIAWNNGCFVK